MAIELNVYCEENYVRIFRTDTENISLARTMKVASIDRAFAGSIEPFVEALRINENATVEWHYD